MLEVSALNAFYGESHILWNVDLKITPGERVAVIGRNGAGKSTLLKSIMNAGPTVEGRVSLEGEDLARLPHFQRVRKGLSLVPEDRRIFTHISVRENLALALQGGGGAHYSVDEMIALFPVLEPLQQRFGNQLSGGQQQMLAIARGFMMRPKLLLLDEPTEGVAPVLVQQMARTVNAMCRDQGIGLLLCEQNLWFSRQCTEKVYVIDAGTIVFGGSWQAFDAEPEIKTRYLAV